MQRKLVALSFLVVAFGIRTAPSQGAPVLLRSAYNRLVKAAAQVEKITGDASLLSKGKHSKAAQRALVEDPQKISKDALHLATLAYAVMGNKPPTSQQKPTSKLNAAYHELLAAAEGIELVRRHADSLAPAKLAAFAAEVQKDPEVDEPAPEVEKLEEDIEEAEKETEATEKDAEVTKTELEVAAAAEEKHDDKADITEAEAAVKAADQGLAEASHEQHGGDELVGKAETALDKDLGHEGKEDQEKEAAEKAEAKKRS